MRKAIILLLVTFSSIFTFAQSLDIQTFGTRTDKPLIFLHGGPGYNSVVFERTTAKNLTENGFFVISYDRRGEGRNNKLKAEFTFDETFKDIDSIYQKFDLQKASLIGHSFGGVIATLYAEKHREKIQTLVLVGVPPSMQETFKNILARSKAIYTEKNDSVNLNYIKMLEEMDNTSLQYSSYCFIHAMQNGFYTTKNPTNKTVEIYSLFKTDESLKKYASKMDYAAPQKFWENEQYTTLSIKNNLSLIKSKGIKVFGLYGKEDGLFSQEQVSELGELLGSENVKYLENCSHNVFIDQQNIFIESLKTWID